MRMTLEAHKVSTGPWVHISTKPVITIVPKSTLQHVWSEIIVVVSPGQMARIRKVYKNMSRPLTWVSPQGYRAHVRLLERSEAR